MTEKLAEENISINKNYFYGFVVILALTIVTIFAFRGAGASTSDYYAPQTVQSTTGNVVATIDSGNTQVVTLKVQGSQYIFSSDTFKKGVPVRIEGDISQMPGCSKSIVISAFNIQKTLTSGDNVIEFTPDKAGTFNIACSMNMYKGTFTVLDSNGSKSNYIEPAKTGGASCGGSSGGCGCGGAK